MALGPFLDPKTGKPDDTEASFLDWYGGHAIRLGIDPNPDAPAHHYDFRNAFLNGYEPNDDGTWDYRASEAFARTAGKRNVIRANVRGAASGDTEADTLTRTSMAEPPTSSTSTAPVELTDAMREEVTKRLAGIESSLATYNEAIDSYTKGYISPEEAQNYLYLSKGTEDYANKLVNHGRTFLKGLTIGEGQIANFYHAGFMPAVSRALNLGLAETGLGAARLLGQGAAAMMPGVPGVPTPGQIDTRVADLRDKIETEFFGLPFDPIERAGYNAAFPWYGHELGNLAAWTATIMAPGLAVGQAGMAINAGRHMTGAAGMANGMTRWLSAARGARGLATTSAVGAVGGALIAAGTAPDDIDGQRILEGAMIGLGGTAMLSTFLAGRPIGNMARLLKIQAMAETLGAEGVGGALRVAPRMTFGRMAAAGLEGAGYSTLKAMGEGQPIDKSIASGVEEGIAFAGYDTAFLGLGRMAKWLPIHARISETWAKTAQSLKLPARMAAASGDMANTVLQAVPGILAGGALGPAGAALGGTISAKMALNLQRDLVHTAARLRNVGVPAEIVNHLLTGSWHKLSAEQAEIVTKALVKDVVERATAEADPILKYAINESLGSTAILDNTELKAITYERARVMQAVATMKSQGILEIDPKMIQATRRIAELSERRSQILIDEANALGIGQAPSTHSGIMGRVSDKVVSAQVRDIIESAGENRGFFVETTVARKRGKPATFRSVIPRLDPNAGSALERLHASIRAASGETAGLARGAASAPPTRVLFATNSTLLRDLADAGLERQGIDAMMSPEGARALDRIIARPGDLSPNATETLLASRKRLTAPVIEGVNVGRETPPSQITGTLQRQLPGRAVAPAGAKGLKRPFTDFDFGDTSGRVGGQAVRSLAGAGLGGTIGAAADPEHPWRGAALGALAGGLGVGAAEDLLRTSARMRSDIGAMRTNIDVGISSRNARLAREIETGKRSAFTAFDKATTEARATVRINPEPLIALAEKQLARSSPTNEVARASFRRAHKAFWDDIHAAMTARRVAPDDIDALFIDNPRLADLRDRVAALDSEFAKGTTAVETKAAGYVFTPAGEIARPGQPPIRYWTSNKPMPITGDKGRVTDDMIRLNGLEPPPIRSGETGAARLGILGPVAAGGIGAVVAPAIARRLGLLDEEDSVLTASAMGFLVGAGLGYKMLARDGAMLNAEATRVARFIQPTVEGQLAPAETARLVGKSGDAFRTTLNGSQVSGRRLYWLLPQDQQVTHTVENMRAWPQRTVDAKGNGIDLPERRASFERDLKRFAPFTVTDADWSRVTDTFMTSTKALGYTPAESMRLYKGWLGWMTTPLASRARTNIEKMSLKVLGNDAKNPFTTAAGIDELRARTLTADVITGPSMPLPRNYQRAANTLNKDGTPAASRIRALVEDIESNPPSTAEGTAETVMPWWSFAGARSVAPSVRFYRYADRLIAGGDKVVGQRIHDVTQGIFEATELARGSDDKDRQILATIFQGISSPQDMNLVGQAVENRIFRESLKGTNARVYEAALGVRKFLKERADALGLPEFERIDDYLPWVYNYRTKRELKELAEKGVTPNDVNYPADAPVPHHVFFNHLESRTADAPLGKLMSPYESLLMYSHGANRKIYMDQLLANFTPETFQSIRASQPWIAHDLGRWLLDVVGIPGPGTMYVQKKVESMGLFLEKYPMFQREGLAQEINERYFLSPSGANNLSRLATGYAYTSKIAWNYLSAVTNLSQQIINGGTEYGIINVLTSSVIGAGVAGGERVPALAPILDAVTPRSAEYRKLLVENGILRETSQRHFDALALYEANFGTNRAHLALVGIPVGAAAGAASTAILNSDRSNEDQLSIATGAALGAGLATFGAAKSAIMRRALMRVRDVGTFTFNLAETWNRASVGIASVRQARATERALASPAYAATQRAREVVEGVFTGALGGAAAGNLLGGSDQVIPGALLGAAAAAGAAPFGESRTARTARTLETIRSSNVIFENRIVRDQAKDGLRKLTDDEVHGLYAQMQTDITQFRIAKEGRGYILNTPHGQALGALQSYTLNQAEFVGGRLQSFIETANRAINGQPAQIDFRVFRFASYLLGVGSVYGAILGGSADSESDPDYWVSRLGFGVMPLLLWNDRARKWEMKPPSDLFRGPLIGDITRTANSYLELIQNEEANASFLDTTDSLVINLFPGAKNIIKQTQQQQGTGALKLFSEGAAESMGQPQPQSRGPR